VVPKDCKEVRVIQDNQVHLEIPGPKELLEMLVPMDQLVIPVFREQQALAANRDHLVPLGSRDSKGLRVFWGLKDHLVL